MQRNYRISAKESLRSKCDDEKADGDNNERGVSIGRVAEMTLAALNAFAGVD